MSVSQLERARNLERPSREAMLQRAPSVQQFWNTNRKLLSEAWHEWEAVTKENLLPASDGLLDADLKEAITQAWQDPSKEFLLANLLRKVSPGVYQLQLFNPERLNELRAYLDSVADAQIPLRPPYGIALNRLGVMLDSRSEGYLAAPSFQSFYRELLDKYMRPIARFLFPELMGYDSQTFGFSIQYQAGVDTSLQLHTDASAATLNINLNLPEEEFTGSEVDFYNPVTGAVNRLSFEPGTAMIHRGNIPHAAQPITSGSRTNLVLWLYGDNGEIPSHSVIREETHAHQRWTVPQDKRDEFAPF
ncbi:hypothetical protein [Agaribacterium sp. ZY112]|uniref:hypothetical protein n=1 Tax=Agaribacterium sp. ZY112 TaxID=3233574 RepID=UPI0035234528